MNDSIPCKYVELLSDVLRCFALDTCNRYGARYEMEILVAGCLCHIMTGLLGLPRVSAATCEAMDERPGSIVGCTWIADYGLAVDFGRILWRVQTAPRSFPPDDSYCTG